MLTGRGRPGLQQWSSIASISASRIPVKPILLMQRVTLVGRPTDREDDTKIEREAFEAVGDVVAR